LISIELHSVLSFLQLVSNEREVMFVGLPFSIPLHHNVVMKKVEEQNVELYNHTKQQKE